MKEELQARGGVNLAIDCLGGSIVGKCLPLMAFCGRWINIATLASDYTEVNLRTMYAKRLRLIGTNLRSRTPDEKKILLEDMVARIWPKIESGEIRPTVYKVYSILEAEAAQDLMYSGKSAGKIVLTVRN